MLAGLLRGLRDHRRARVFTLRRKVLDAGLSADAVPRLIDGLHTLPADDGCLLATSLKREWEHGLDGLRSWNWGRHAARQSVNDHQSKLAAACDP